MRWTLGMLWLGSLVAQDPTVADLRDGDWRVRNAAAAALTTAPTIDVAALVEVLRGPWDGNLPELGRYGGRGAGNPKFDDPRQQVLANERQSWWRGRPDNWLFPYQTFRPETARDLVIPHHPHTLALWLLRQRTAESAPIVAAVEQAGLKTFELALLWLSAQPRSLADVSPLLKQKETSSPLALALWHQGDAGRDLLREALAQNDQTTTRAAVALGEESLLSGTAQLAAAVAQLVGDLSEPHRLQAAWLLEQIPATSVPAIALRLGESSLTLRRATGLLCRLGEKAEPAGAALLPFVDCTDRPTRHRVLVALGSFDLPAALRPDAARRLFEVLESKRDDDTRVLALDALARQADGVDAAMRERLATMLSAPPFAGADARALGCLRRLGAVPPMETVRKGTLATQPLANTDTWLALADDGAAGAALLQPLFAGPDEGRDVEACARQLAATAPQVLTQWLDADPALQRVAIKGLRSLGERCDVPTGKIVKLLAVAPDVAIEALRWLATRPDVARFHEPLCAALVQWPPSGAVGLGTELVATLKIPPEVKFTGLEPILREGRGFEAVRNLPPNLQREAFRRWLAETENAEHRDGLLGELARLGLQEDDEIAQVVAALGTMECWRLLDGLEAAPSLPPAVRTELQDLIDRFSTAKGFGNLSGEAVRVLWHHRLQ